MHKKKMIVKDDKDSNVVELKVKKSSISKLGSQVDIYAAATRAIDEKMKMLVLHNQPCFGFCLIS
jgi:hypothetical protein